MDAASAAAAIAATSATIVPAGVPVRFPATRP